MRTLRLAPLALFCVTACATTPAPAFELQHFGAMREVMMEGKTGPRAALSRYEQKGCYAVGALAGLAGEVMIDDGVVFVSRDRAEKVADRAGNAQATLLTIAQVRNWRELPLGEGADLDAIEAAIRAALPDPKATEIAPLPFLVIAPATAIAMHVARGVCPHGASDPEHQPDVWRNDPAHGAVAARVVGFFAPGQAGVMTHHGTAIHAHAMATARSGTKAMGHVDSLVVGPGARLLLPALTQ